MIFYVELKMHAMNKKDKFFMLLALSCLPLSEMAAEQVDGMAVSPITQEVLQNSVKITGRVVDVQGEPVIGATVMEKVPPMASLQMLMVTLH